MTDVQSWAAQWGDLASLAGVAIALLGFGATLIGVWRARTAAEAARDASKATRKSLAHYDAIADLSSAMAMMEEIKRLQRHGGWSALPERYGDLRRRLVAIKESGLSISEGQRQTLQATVETFADLERRVDRAVVAGGVPANPAKLNDIVSTQLDEVHAVLLSLQRSLKEQQ